MKGDILCERGQDTCAFDRTIFLDTDTTIVGPIEELFRLLDRFDIGLYVLPR
jgi:hypothetical protein